MDILTSRLQAQAGIVTSIVRVVVGALLFWHGYRKFADGLENFEGFLSFLELPVPGVLAVVVALLELVGGAMLVLGIGTRPVALLFVAQFALLIVWVRFVQLDDVSLLAASGDNTIELDLMFLVSSLFLATSGPGTLSADKALGLEPDDTRVKVGA